VGDYGSECGDNGISVCWPARLRSITHDTSEVSFELFHNLSIDSSSTVEKLPTDSHGGFIVTSAAILCRACDVPVWFVEKGVLSYGTELDRITNGL
jgi:hypothetical protein